MDIKGHTAIRGGTIPPDVLVTSLKPYIVIVHNMSITIIELSVPFETNIKSRHDFKCEKYAYLVKDLHDLGFEVNFHALEIGSRGYISSSNLLCLSDIFSNLNKKVVKQINREISKSALMSSFAIFFSKYTNDWVLDDNN